MNAIELFKNFNS